MLDTIKINIFKFLWGAIALLSPIKYIMLLVGVFIILDTVFGVWCSHKTGKQITSRKLSKFISKMLVYQLVIITVYALDVLLLGEFLLHFISIDMVTTKIVSILLISNEIYSIDEKLVAVKQKGLWHYFKRLIGVAKLIKKETEELK